MKVLTVRQPWAWAIVHGGKAVENRTWLTSYRGPVAIHAGRGISMRGMRSQLVREAAFTTTAAVRTLRGVIIGVVELIDAHWASDGCCDSDWAEYQVFLEDERAPGPVAHWLLTNPRPVDPPHPWRGQLGLRDLPADIVAGLQV